MNQKKLAEMVENRLTTLATDVMAEDEMTVATFGIMVKLEAKALGELIVSYPITSRRRRASGAV